jgi:hypothetical protein
MEVLGLDVTPLLLGAAVLGELQVVVLDLMQTVELTCCPMSCRRLLMVLLV